MIEMAQGEIKPSALKDKVEEIEKEMILDALEQSNWVKAKAAKMLGITERIIDYKMKKYGLKKVYIYKDGVSHTKL